MAKYNQSRFNLARYNRSTDAPAVLDKIQIGALFQAFIGLGQKTKDALKAESAFSGDFKIATGTLEQSQLETNITAIVSERYIAHGHDTMAAEFEEDLYMSPLVKERSVFDTIFAGEIYLSPKVIDVLTFDSEISCKTYLGNKVRDVNQIMAYAIFGGSISAEALEEIILDLAVTIPPNGILVIDSDNFRVLLNGTNAIKYHSGDWIDQLNRSSKSITIQGGGNSLTATIYFQELWL